MSTETNLNTNVAETTVPATNVPKVTFGQKLATNHPILNTAANTAVAGATTAVVTVAVVWAVDKLASLHEKNKARRAAKKAAKANTAVPQEEKMEEKA